MNAYITVLYLGKEVKCQLVSEAIDKACKLISSNHGLVVQEMLRDDLTITSLSSRLYFDDEMKYYLPNEGYIEFILNGDKEDLGKYSGRHMNISRVEKWIPISAIKTGKLPINKKTLELVEFLKGGGEVPPIKVAKNPKGGYLMKDGRHRLTAMKLLGHESIKAKFSNKPLMYFLQ